MDKVQRRKQILLNHLSQQTSPINTQLLRSPTSNSKPSIEIVKYHTENGVAYITLNSAPVNSITAPMVKKLSEYFQTAQKDQSVRAIVIKSNLPRVFIAGADIASLQRFQDNISEGIDYIESSNELLNKFENSPKPVVAALNGITLGGGLELAMSCHARVSTPQSTFGLPELKLGIIPGFGGTQRLPRLVGVQKSVEMMLTSKSINGNEAKKLGLVDELVNDKELLEKSTSYALKIADGKLPKRKSLLLVDKLGPLKASTAIIKFAGEQAKKVNPFVTHTHACLRSILEGVEKGGIVGLQKEKEEFLKLSNSNVARALMHFFYATKSISKIPGEKVKAKEIKKVGIIGGGLMGSGIAVACLLAGYTVFLKEINQEFLNKGLNNITSTLKRSVQKKKLTQEKYNSIVKDKLVGKLDYSDFNTLDLVIEAVIEKEDLKQRIFKDLENVCNPQCILSSNTSTIDIDLIGEKTKAQDRILGLHFFSPAHVMPLLEIVKTKHTSNQTLQTCLEFGKRIRKMCVVVGNCVGFTVNRIFFPYGVATHYLIDNGVDPYHIDNVIKNKFGMPMGPCRLYDMTGIDVIYHVARSIGGAYDDLKYPMNLINLLTTKYNRLGQKTGSGYYRYEKGNKNAIKDEEFISKLLKETRKPDMVPLKLSDEEIIEYIFYPVVNESCKVLEEGMVYRGSDIDVASTLGMGFPAHLGGILKWGDLTGARKVYDKLNSLYQTTGQKLFKPSKHLKECALSGRSLYLKF